MINEILNRIGDFEVVSQHNIGKWSAFVTVNLPELHDQKLYHHDVESTPAFKKVRELLSEYAVTPTLYKNVGQGSQMDLIITKPVFIS